MVWIWGLEADLINVEHVFRPRVGSYVVATIQVTADNQGEINTLMRDMGAYTRDGRFSTSNAIAAESSTVQPIIVPPDQVETDGEVDLDKIDFDPITGAPREMP
jgi:hypothetical protein